MKLSQEQVRFFQTFGYLKFPGLFKNEIEVITEEFEKVLAAFQKILGEHDGSKRTMVGGCVDASPILSGLLDDERIVGICEALLGEKFNYYGSDGNFYSGNSGWHPDGNEPKYLHLKIAFYLDELNASNGALRVIPGSHRENDQFAQDVKSYVRDSVKHLGLQGWEVPAQVVDNVPGDLVVFNHRLFHSAWHGGPRRRMFTMNMCEHYADEDLDQMRRMILNHLYVHIDQYYGPAMIETAGPERMKHLEQMNNLVDWDAFTKKFPEAIRVSV